MHMNNYTNQDEQSEDILQTIQFIVKMEKDVYTSYFVEEG